MFSAGSYKTTALAIWPWLSVTGISIQKYVKKSITFF